MESPSCFRQRLAPSETLAATFSAMTGFHNLDFSVSKSWRFYEKLTMQFRAEMFNITNHPNFANPFGGATGQGVGATADPSVPSSSAAAALPQTPLPSTRCSAPAALAPSSSD